MPVTEKERYLTHDAAKYSLEQSFIIVYDTESFLKAKLGCQPDPATSFTDVNQIHIINSYAYIRICLLQEKYTSSVVSYVGPNAAFHLLESLEKEVDQIYLILQQNERMKISQDQEDQVKQEKYCFICKQEISAKDKRVRHHDHISGNFLGVAHDTCNIQASYIKGRHRKMQYKVKVFAHNNSKYYSCFYQF
jgi:hypothetical protein